MASQFARKLGLPLALIDKDRFDAFNVGMHYFVGDVKGKTVIIPDDMCSTGGTLVNAANVCARLGAERVIAVVGHGLFIGEAIHKITGSAIELVVTTNSVPTSEAVRAHPKFSVVSIASMLCQNL
jgi:ribose-phosphate pyrophosphokinase